MSVSRLLEPSPLRTGTAVPRIIAEAAGFPAAPDYRLSSAGTADPPTLCNSGRVSTSCRGTAVAEWYTRHYRPEHRYRHGDGAEVRPLSLA